MTAGNPLVRLGQLGQSPWYDYITRDLPASGELARLIAEDGLRGMTSNPTIFEKAIGGSRLYDEEIRRLTDAGRGAQEIFEHLAVADVRAACDAFAPVHEASAGSDGLVSLEVSPDLANDTAATIHEAERLWRALDRPNAMIKIPGTAVVVLAGLLNAARVVGKPLEDMRIVLVGVGAAGVAVSKLLLEAGVTDIVGCDRNGALHPGIKGLTAIQKWYARHTNPRKFIGTANEALRGADVFIGLSGPGAVSVEAVKTMADDAIVFAMANPEPEVHPEEIEGHVRVIATGRSDYPNQVNNVLAFPGIFRGALATSATTINEPMNLAAARAIAAVIPEEELFEEYVIPSVFNRTVVETVAAAVGEAAIETGVAQRASGPPTDPTAIYR